MTHRSANLENIHPDASSMNRLCPSFWLWGWRNKYCCFKRSIPSTAIKCTHSRFLTHAETKLMTRSTFPRFGNNTLYKYSRWTIASKDKSGKYRATRAPNITTQHLGNRWLQVLYFCFEHWKVGSQMCHTFPLTNSNIVLLGAAQMRSFSPNKQRSCADNALPFLPLNTINFGTDKSGKQFQTSHRCTSRPKPRAKQANGIH